MELLSKSEIDTIVMRCGYSNSTVISWSFEDLSDKVIGYLGDHLKLNISVVSGGQHLDLKLFVKCMPRSNEWKSEYLKELNFFKKEFIMLSELFKDFPDKTGLRQWRPKLYFIREDLFVFEDITIRGYQMPNHQHPMNLEDIIATVKTIARFHSESFIYEENRNKSEWQRKDLGKPYSIWDDFKDFLQEPTKGKSWRDTGRNAVIDFLKEFSSYKNEPHFNKKVETVIPVLFDGAWSLMKPNFANRNVVVHRDLWTNNILLKRDGQNHHALIIDFQTVLYCSPMLDLSSFIYFNTTKIFRKKYTKELINIYYETLAEELNFAHLNIRDFFDLTSLHLLYDESIMFGITQAALILPLATMTSEKKIEIFCDPENAARASVVSRSKDFIEIAKENRPYHDRVIELFDEIVEKYIQKTE